MLRVAEHVERTDTGRARSANEDSYFARSPLFAIADGMGGAQAGEVASTVAVEVLEQGLPTDGGSVEERLARRVSEANARINDLSRSDQELAGMGTTLTAVLRRRGRDHDRPRRRQPPVPAARRGRSSG